MPAKVSKRIVLHLGPLTANFSLNLTQEPHLISLVLRCVFI